MIIISTFLLFMMANGYSDAAYVRVATPKQTSLILGTSRAAQGMNPAVINKVLDRDDLFNFSFTNANSPYGPVYLESVKLKLTRQIEAGIFILAVNPWSLSSMSEDPNEINAFREHSLYLSRLENVSQYPNLSYLMNHYGKPYYHLLAAPYYSKMFVHETGWLKVDIPMDFASIESRTKVKIQHYRENVLPYYKFSTKRFEYLEKTIVLLQERGPVYLVRLPVGQRMKEIENELMPDFDERVKKLSRKNSIAFLSFSEDSERFTFTDGNHLGSKSASAVSKEIAEWILKCRRSRTSTQNLKH